MGVAATIGLFFFLAEPERGYRQRLDLFGFAWLSIFIGALQLFLDRALASEPQFFHDVGDNGNLHNRDEPWCHAACDAANGGALHLALKSGNFGAPDFFSGAFEVL